MLMSLEIQKNKKEYGAKKLLLKIAPILQKPKPYKFKKMMNPRQEKPK